jgi:hypothetical protein
MNNTSNVKIEIYYQLIDSRDWIFLELTPDEYFDLEPDEKVELDCLPRYNHAIEYLDVENEQVIATKIILIDEILQAKRSIVERYWNHGRNRAIERTDIGEYPYWEMILEVQVSANPPLWEIIRLAREDGVITPLYHGFIKDNNDGSQTETQIKIEAI